MNNITKIIWNLNNHCKSECYYCPVSLRGGDRPRETDDYLRIANLLIENYKSLDRIIDWEFNGGEPLDMDNIVTLLKLCKENGNSMTLHTNGGKLWIDWWAIEQYVDNLNLSFHYWQNKSLVHYIIETFLKKGKMIKVSVPIRPEFFDYDINTAIELEIKYGIIIGKSVLYKSARKEEGQYPYTDEQLAIMSGEITSHLVQEKEYFETTTWHQRHAEKYETNPIYLGKFCNAGIEYLNISHEGWVMGSACRNQPLGNIWNDNWQPPTQAQVCTMQACVDTEDQKITKF